MLRFLLLVLLLVLAPEALAQPVRASDMVTWRVRAETAAPGETARIVLDAQIVEGWRLYALDSPVGRPLVVTLDALPDGFTAGAVRQSEPQTGYDAGFELDYPYFATSARVAQAVQLSETALAGRHMVEGAVAFAVCDDSVCLPPARIPFRVPLVVASR